MTSDKERRLFADGLLRTCNGWLCAGEWIARDTLELPEDWLAAAYEDPSLWAGGLTRYIDAAEFSEPVTFGEPYRVVENGEWIYQPVVDHEPTEANAEVCAFFEALTPDAEWRLSWVAMAKDGRKVPKGPLLSRVAPDGTVLFALAGRHPLIAEAAA